MLTGGASRMDFTLETCRDVFRDAHVFRDSEPEHCVSRGLASLGRWEVMTDGFLDEVGVFCDSAELAAIVEPHVPDLMKDLGPVLVEALFDKVANPLIKDWLVDKVDLSDGAFGPLREYGRRWEASPEAAAACGPALERFRGRVSPAVNERTAAICERYGIPRQSLKLTVALPKDTLADAFRWSDPIEQMAGWTMDKLAGIVHRFTPSMVKSLVPNAAVDLYLWTQKKQLQFLTWVTGSESNVADADRLKTALADGLRQTLKKELRAMAARASIHIQ